VIEAHGGTWFRTPCPNCRAKPFKVLSVSGSAPTPQKGPFRGCDLRSAFWRPVGSDSQAGTSFLGPTRHKPAPATRGSEGRWFNSRPLSRNGQRLLVTSWHNDGDRRQHGGMVTAPWPRRRPQTICDSPSDSAIHLRILRFTFGFCDSPSDSVSGHPWHGPKFQRLRNDWMLSSVVRGAGACAPSPSGIQTSGRGAEATLEATPTDRWMAPEPRRPSASLCRVE